MIRPTRAFGSFFLAMAIAGCPHAAAQGTPGDPLEAQGLIARWIGLERQKDALAADWRARRPVLEQQLLLLGREEGELESLLRNSERQQDQVEERRLELLREQETLEARQRDLERTLGESIAVLRRIHPQLPPPLHESWTRLMPRLELEGASASERLQAVTDMLGRLHDFQQKITLHEAMLTAPDGDTYLVRQVYLGLSHGWYLSADGSLAGAGSPTPDGWRWRAGAPSEAVAELIAQVEGRGEARLVSIPLELTSGGEARP